MISFNVIIKDWDLEPNSDGEAEKIEVKKEVVPKKEEVKYGPSKPILKDKYGEIIINTLEAYVEPKKDIKEARGDTSKQNNKLYIK